jgi:TetR/AcrR family transcriptional regulator, cholesterol catabolism regulator
MAQRQTSLGDRFHDQDKVLSNAARLFREKGFDKTSLKAIADACNMLPGSLYYRYKTKEALLVELMRQGIFLVSEEVKLANCKSDDPLEQLRLCINAHLRVLLSDSDMVYILLFEWRALSPEARKEVIQLRDQYESFWMDFIQKMVELGIISKGVDIHLFRLVGLGALNWVATWFDPKGTLTPDSIGDFIWKSIVWGVIAPSEQFDNR